MPGTTKPNKPRPKQIDFADGTHSYISCEDQLEVGTPIFDLVGSTFFTTPNGIYNLQGGGSITVTNGIITNA